ncbi:hypothetical protein HOG17_02950 [Candidatus Peregrinibacteria bacterium]|jgi:hypothetical protein|nr:hypothetical protein [Candidatus Peregrinibacteria bacterium]MBT4148547.1 hypothetical protein [Candidatus Peregrinibacteria bacterium]MBT4456141.1 hypothetical protein [Candidatus Peregrinibacteria bacterium]
MTVKQKKFFQSILDSPSYAEAARKAGYSEKSCRVSACRNITKYNEFFVRLMREADIDTDSLAKNLKQGLNAENEGIKFRYTKLALDLLEKVLNNEKLEEELEYDEEIKEKTSEEHMIDRFMFALRLAKWTESSMAFIDLKDLPENVQMLQPEEVVKRLKIEKYLTGKSKRTPKEMNSCFVQRAKDSLPSKENNTTKK